MHLISSDLTVLVFAHQGHTFRVDPAQLTNPANALGAADPSLLATPVMTCTDPGCGFQVQSVFPVGGDGNAQMVHTYARAAKGGIALPLAAQSVVEDAHGKGAPARVDPNPPVPRVVPAH